MSGKNQLRVFRISFWIMKQFHQKLNQLRMEIYIKLINTQNTAVSQNIQNRFSKRKEFLRTGGFIPEIK